MPSYSQPLRIMRVLVVDNMPSVADSLVEVLRVRNYDARAAYSAEQAIAIASTFCPNVVISDVFMQPMNGVMLGIYLEKMLPECKLLLMSGHVKALDYVEPMTLGGHPYPLLGKPFDPEEIFGFLNDVEVHRLMSELSNDKPASTA